MTGTDLSHFVAAQDPVWPDVLAELNAGRKTTHWMWFVFPQIAGLGRSATAQRFALGSLEEARAYLAHTVLGPRLRAAARALLAHRGTQPEKILGPIDALKLRSSMTLFAAAARDEKLFGEVLDAFYGGASDPRTLERLRDG